MKKANDDVFAQRVREHGGRLTPQRKEVYTALCSVSVPQTIQGLKKRVAANEVSVYRTIYFLKQAGLVEEIVYPDGSRRYARKDHHHHHIICGSCGHTEHIPCNDTLKASPAIHPQFATIDTHDVTYHGTCVRCR